MYTYRKYKMRRKLRGILKESLRIPFAAGKLLALEDAMAIARTNSRSLIIPVSSFKGARDGHPEEYPGKRPPASYLYLKPNNREASAYLMAFSDTNDPYSAHVLLNGRFIPVRDIIREMGLPPMEEQYLLIGYGSNPCPGQIKAKVEQGRMLGVEGVAHFMMVFRGQVVGHDPVISSFIEAGYPIAGILRNEKTKHTRAEVWGTLLTRPMLEAFNVSEKVIDPLDSNKSDSNAQYAVADGYPFQIDGVISDGKPLVINTAAYTGNANIYSPVLELESGAKYRGPIAFDTLPAENRAFPTRNVPQVFRIILENMAREDARYEIDRLLLERGITTAEMCSLIPEIGVLPAKGMTREMKTLVLMRWMNREWNRIENGERTHADMELTKAVISHMTDVAHSEPCDMVAVKKAEGAVFSREEADAPEKVKLGNLIRP